MSQKRETGAPAPHRDQPGDRAALVIIDMINPFDFESGEEARTRAETIARSIVQIRAVADANDLPTIYVNDNFGQWHSDRDRLIAAARPALANGAIEPREQDFFIVKPQFSGFYATNLAVLLPKLGVRRLILTGIATEICVFLTAADAHMRDYALWIPKEGVVSLNAAHGAAALAILKTRMNARTASVSGAAVADWLCEPPSPSSPSQEPTLPAPKWSRARSK